MKDRCINCGCKLKVTGEVPLCEQCAACETLYAAIVKRIKRQLMLTARSFSVYMCIAAILCFGKPFERADIIGFMVFYFGIASSALTAVMYLSQYLQLRARKRAEEAAAPVPDTADSAANIQS